MVLPPRFEGHAEDEVRAALLHELAHVRRRDYLVNLMCQIAALPAGWHPAVYGIQQRIRRTREMLCDAIAAVGDGLWRALCAMSVSHWRGKSCARRMEGGGVHAGGLVEKKHDGG